MVTPLSQGCPFRRLVAAPPLCPSPPLPTLPAEMGHGAEPASGWAGAKGKKAQDPAGLPWEPSMVGKAKPLTLVSP